MSADSTLQTHLLRHQWQAHDEVRALRVGTVDDQRAAMRSDLFLLRRQAVATRLAWRLRVEPDAVVADAQFEHAVHADQVQLNPAGKRMATHIVERLAQHAV